MKGLFRVFPKDLGITQDSGVAKWKRRYPPSMGLNRTIDSGGRCGGLSMYAHLDYLPPMGKLH
jgi:hypothetical protein